MSLIRPCLALAACTSLIALAASAGECRAQGGRYRAVTSFSVPSTPVYMPAVPLQSAYRPLIVAPAAAMPVASAPIAVTPPIILSQPQAAYYAPAPVMTYYAPPVAVQPIVVARPAFYRRARNVYSFTPGRAAPAPVLVP